MPATALRSYHAEGPAWDRRTDQLIWIDQYAGLVHLGRYLAATSTLELERTYELGAAVGAVVPASAPDGGWMAACAAGFAHLAVDGTVTLLEQPEAGAEGTTRMNDGKCDSQGRFWAGSMARDKRPGAGSLYRMDADLSVRVMLTEVTISNGLAWAQEDRTMYYIDTPTGRIDVLRLDAGGRPVERRPLARVDGSDGVPDGMCIDDEGCLWVALWGGFGVRRYSPGGELIDTLEIDAPLVSSCCFGGPEGRTLFITTSQEDMDEATREAHPQSGKVFCAELAVGGPPAEGFQGATPGLRGEAR